MNKGLTDLIKYIVACITRPFLKYDSDNGVYKCGITKHSYCVNCFVNDKIVPLRESESRFYCCHCRKLFYKKGFEPPYGIKYYTQDKKNMRKNRKENKK